MVDNVYGVPYEEYVEDILKKPEKEFTATGNYYHYTSVDNCIKMLAHEDGVFEMWASHLAFLNDQEEHVNGLKMIERKVEDLLLCKGDDLSDWTESYKERKESESAMANELFVICFCSRRSLLSQWKYYGKNSGVAIQYNLDRCEYSGYIEGVENIKEKQQRFIRNYPHKVIYDNLEKQNIIDNFIKEKIYNIYKSEGERQREIERNMDRLYSFAPLFKHDSFEEENESRLLFKPIYLQPATDASNLIHYRTSGGKIIPYMKIKIRGRKEGVLREPVIMSLTVGPGQNQDLVFDALKHFVANKFPKEESHFDLINRKDYSYIKVNGIEIRKASVPFRG